MKQIPSLTVIVELITPTVFVVATYLLVSGHDRPGGGFIAGLVFAAVPVIRHAAGLRILPGGRAIQLLGAGVTAAALVAMAGVLVGDPLLTHYQVQMDLPLFGAVKGSTILVFDVGVAAVVVGLVTVVVDRLDGDPAEHARAARVIDR